MCSQRSLDPDVGERADLAALGVERESRSAVQETRSQTRAERFVAEPQQTRRRR